METWLLGLELSVMFGALALSPWLGRGPALHIVIGSFICYQTVVLDVTRGTPNIGVVWFLLIPTWSALWGRAWHVVIWVPLSVAAISWTAWRADPSDPVWQHPLSFANLLGVLGFSAALVVGFHWDRVRREKQLTRAVRRVREETRERQSAEAKARAAEFSKSRMLAMLSHELRTPMTGLALTADMLLEDELSTQQHVPLRRLRQSATAMLRTLDDILDLVRLEAGVAQSIAVPFSLLDLVEDIAEIVAPQARDSGVRLVLDVDPRMRDAWKGDRARLRQVLLNLLGNALKHTRTGAVRVRVREEEESGGLCFDVQDTGVGIASEVLDEVFEPFIQHSTASSEKRTGAGLGLSISRDFVHAMGGTMWIESEVGRGTSIGFRVLADPAGDDTVARRVSVGDVAGRRLSLRGSSQWARSRTSAWLEAWGVVNDPDAEAVIDLDSDAVGVESSFNTTALAAAIRDALGLRGDRPPPEPTAPRVSSLRGRACLVVDDDAMVRELVGRVFERVGCEVVLASDGEQALGYLRAREFDLVILDLQMPGMTGLEVLTRLRTTPLQRMPPIAVLSGSSAVEQAALDAGAQAFVVKPARAQALLHLAEQLVP